MKIVIELDFLVLSIHGIVIDFVGTLVGKSGRGWSQKTSPVDQKSVFQVTSRETYKATISWPLVRFQVTEFHSFTEFYLVLSSFTDNLLSIFTEFYRFTVIYRVSPIFHELYNILPSLTAFYRADQNLSIVDFVLQMNLIHEWT